MKQKPTTEEVLDCVTQDSRIPLDRIRNQEGGHLYDEETVLVEPRDADCDARLEIADPTMMSELRDVIREGTEVRASHSHLLISRRMPNHYNSYGTDFETLRSRYGSNPAFMHPADLAALAVTKGDPLVIRSSHGEVEGIAWPDPGLRRGLVSMSHCWGDNPDVDDPQAEPGANTGRLSSVEVDYDPYTGIPKMSAIPVDVLSAVGGTKPH
jgi:anaerobic selenocysteine-containing dehydrogenase